MISNNIIDRANIKSNATEKIKVELMQAREKPWL